jgi:endonuclease-8
MAEGDTIARIATVLGGALLGHGIVAARARPGGPQLERLVGAQVTAVEARGKHLLIGFDNGLTLHTHLGLHGSWHRYRRGEPWRRSATRAAAVLELPDVVAACFDAPTVELLKTRALPLHPLLRRLGPDASTTDFDLDAALTRLRAPANAVRQVGDTLLDQRIVAGLGNVYRSELCFIERTDPRTPVGQLDEATLRRLLAHGHRLLRANGGGGRRITAAPGSGGALYVYGRSGRPCRRCGTPITGGSAAEGRRLFWCPRCQPPAALLVEPERAAER